MSRLAPSFDPGPIRIPGLRARRSLYFGAVVGTTLLGSVLMVDIVRAAGITALEVGILLLFVPTFGWISVSFWNAVIGFALRVLRRDPLSLERLHRPVAPSGPITSRTALVMPAHNEDPRRLTNGLEAMIRSLEATGHAGHFDVHLLSDTTDPGLAAREEEAWRALRDRAPRQGRLHYRRRPDNTGKKAGNIAEFCARCADDYDLMVVLDADSVMSGRTLVGLVRAMEANPEAGLIQTVPIPARQETLFGRLVQLAAALYSPMLAAGQAFWQGDEANYWGHNAILRLRPFLEHGRLPLLPGSPPLGGRILSHDFVEAALLGRAGWRVYLLPQAEGSWEEVPANVLDYAKRDRRWAQGSLQHLRLLRGHGFAPLSGVHFVFGAMGYLSSVLWMLLLLAGTAYVGLPGLSADPFLEIGGAAGAALDAVRSPVPLLALTAVILFLPKALGLASALLERPAAFGGPARLVGSALAETLFSVVLAPVMMVFHTRFVLEIAAGHDVEWGAQARAGREVAWRESLARTAPVTALGLAWGGLTLAVSPTFFLWLSPIFVGLVLAAPLVRWTSGPAAGRWLRRHGWLLVPAEVDAPSELPAGGERATTRTHMFAGPEPLEDRRARGAVHSVERGIFELRRGRPLLVNGAAPESATVLCAAVEGLDPHGLEELRRMGSGPLRLVVTAKRARVMGLYRPDGDAGVSVGLNGESAAEVFRLSSAPDSCDDERADARAATEAEAAALALTRIARLLPAVACVPARPGRVPELATAIAAGTVLRVDVADVRAAARAGATPVEITYVSDARVPLEYAEETRFMLFREANGLLEHVAILIGDRSRWPDPLPVRIHSACLTGDLFGSLRCDCGEQLRGSLRSFAASGGGVLLYLQQEGRGIGLANKLRAYALQQEGLDTVDADGVLGFGADERRYEAAVGMLRHLGVERVRLLTNNPQKVRALEEGGIQVADREPLHGTLNRHNLPYVRAKVQRAGHWLGDMLHGA